MERVQKEKTGYQAAKVMEDITFKEARNQYLRYKIGVYKSPNKIIAAAEAENMAVAAPSDIIVLKVEDENGKRED